MSSGAIVLKVQVNVVPAGSLKDVPHLRLAVCWVKSVARSSKESADEEQMHAHP